MAHFVVTVGPLPHPPVAATHLPFFLGISLPIQIQPQPTISLLVFSHHQPVLPPSNPLHQPNHRPPPLFYALPKSQQPWSRAPPLLLAQVPEPNSSPLDPDWIVKPPKASSRRARPRLLATPSQPRLVRPHRPAARPAVPGTVSAPPPQPRAPLASAASSRLVVVPLVQASSVAAIRAPQVDAFQDLDDLAVLASSATLASATPEHRRSPCICPSFSSRSFPAVSPSNFSLLCLGIRHHVAGSHCLSLGSIHPLCFPLLHAVPCLLVPADPVAAVAPSPPPTADVALLPVERTPARLNPSQARVEHAPRPRAWLAASLICRPSQRPPQPAYLSIDWAWPMVYTKRENAGSWNSGLKREQILETYSMMLLVELVPVSEQVPVSVPDPLVDQPDPLMRSVPNPQVDQTELLPLSVLEPVPSEKVSVLDPMLKVVPMCETAAIISGLL
nr:proline-rich protein 36-like [Aegilops tauschii subsp. strangulata]